MRMGTTESGTGKSPLHVDHIDGDWRNNRPENLRVLCPNHHASTSNYGALNRGKGRPYHVVKKTDTSIRDTRALMGFGES